jgi:membrane fusion protein, multidrug efflux system
VTTTLISFSTFHGGSASKAVVLVGVLALGWSGCGSGSKADEAAPAAVESAASSEAPPVNVSVETVVPTSLKDELQLAGRLAPWVEVDVSTELGGTVQEVGFEKGRRVDQGQVLARIGTDLLQAALDEAEAELVAAEANYNKTKELFDRQAVPRQDLVSGTSSYKRAEARVTAAKLRVERSILRAPVAGIAVTREIEPGEVVAPGARVAVIHQVLKLKATAGIPENDISYFKIGGEAQLEIDAYPGRDFHGRIYFLGTAATEQNRSFPVEIEVDNRSSELRPGMIVRVSLVRRVYDDAIVVPRDAVLERDNGSVVFVREGERAQQRAVTTGPSESGRIVVLDGLAPGEELIVSGHRNLVDGQRVRPVTQGASSEGDAK